MDPKVVVDGQKNPFKYVFFDQAQKQVTSDTGYNAGYADTPIINNIMDTILNDYQHNPCYDRVRNDYAELWCLETITLGTDRYLKFKLISRSKESFDVLKADLVVQTLGGFTGLSLKNETPSGVEQIIKNKNLRYNEETTGIVKLPNITINENQRVVLSVYTSRGKKGDLTMRVK